MLMVRVNAKPRNISIIQVYAPTTTNTEEDVNLFYEEVVKMIRKVPRRDILIVMGDFNAKGGEAMTDDYPTVVGRGGLGSGNEAGERLVEFCLDNELRLCNTWFEHHPRRLYTWTSPDGNTRNQIDYIAIAQKWAGSIRNCRVYPGADCDSDHNLLIAKLKIKLVKKKNGVQAKRLNIEELYGQKAEEYNVEVNNRFEELGRWEEERKPNDLWEDVKTILLDVAEATIGYKKKQKCKPWITNETYELITEKRAARNRDKERYRALKGEVQKRIREDKQQQIETMCEESNKRGDIRRVYQTVRTLTGKFRPQLTCVKSKTDEEITKKEEVAERWKEYSSIEVGILAKI